MDCKKTNKSTYMSVRIEACNEQRAMTNRVEMEKELRTLIGVGTNGI